LGKFDFYLQPIPCQCGTVIIVDWINNNENLILYFKYCLKASATVVRKPPNALYIPTPSRGDKLVESYM